MSEKTIKGSRRGLTFSFDANESFQIGQHYDYILDRKEKTIRIVASDTGKYKLSRKRAGEGYRPLIDLRNREIMEAIKEMASLRISISGQEIIVSDAYAPIRARKAAPVLRLPRVELRHLRSVVGMSSAEAAAALITGVQISLDDYLSESTAFDLTTATEDLADVYTVVSLFSGAGILDWPFATDKQFKIQYAIDCDAAACETYRNNIGYHIVHGDVHNAFSDDGYALDHVVSNPDVVLGGPSCKPFSNANRHTRLSDHPDSDLVVQYMRIVETLRPKVFAMENVPEVLTACDGSYFSAIREAAEKCGYQIQAKIVEDDELGGFTKRRRAVIFGSRIGNVTISIPKQQIKRHTTRDALSRVDSSWSNFNDCTVPSRTTQERMAHVPQGGNWSSIPKELMVGMRQDRHSNSLRRLSWDQPAPTLVNWRKANMIHPTENRTLTVAEAKALQGLPADFRIYGTIGQMQQQVGNAVPVAIGEYIKQVILQSLKGPLPLFT